MYNIHFYLFFFFQAFCISSLLLLFFDACDNVSNVYNNLRTYMCVDGLVQSMEFCCCFPSFRNTVLRRERIDIKRTCANGSWISYHFVDYRVQHSTNTKNNQNEGIVCLLYFCISSIIIVSEKAGQKCAMCVRLWYSKSKKVEKCQMSTSNVQQERRKEAKMFCAIYFQWKHKKRKNINQSINHERMTRFSV